MGNKKHMPSDWKLSTLTTTLFTKMKLAPRLRKLHLRFSCSIFLFPNFVRGRGMKGVNPSKFCLDLKAIWFFEKSIIKKKSSFCCNNYNASNEWYIAVSFCLSWHLVPHLCPQHIRTIDATYCIRSYSVNQYSSQVTKGVKTWPF